MHLTDADPARAGRAFSQAAVELTLASYPGCTLTTRPGDATPFGVFTAGSVPQEDVAHVAVLPSGERVAIPAPRRTAQAAPSPRPARPGPAPAGATFRVPLGTVVGARSGDKGGDANVGVWARGERAYAWLHGYLVAEAPAAIVLIDPPVGANPANVTSADETAIATAHPGLADTIRLFFVGGLASGNGGERIRCNCGVDGSKQ